MFLQESLGTKLVEDWAIKDGPYLELVPHNQHLLPSGPKSTTTELHVKILYLHREKTCLDLLWIGKCSVEDLAVLALSVCCKYARTYGVKGTTYE